jgi:UDP-N-acetylglucosamine 2-epimerase (non-hydrolysing)
MIKILGILGTRPEVIKMAPVIQKLKQLTGEVEVQICTTSQHRIMQDKMMHLFGLHSNYDLNVMKPNQDLFYLTSEILLQLKDVLQHYKPDWVLVQGDTTTSFAGALAAFYSGIKIGHIEAGLRTYNFLAPFPEEANRQLTSRLATIHFAPTKIAQNHLLREGIPKERIFITGNTAIDTLLWMQKHFNMERICTHLPKYILNLINTGRPYILITGHRRENFGNGFLSICNAIQTLANRYPAWSFVYPVHLNPNVYNTVFKLLSGYSNIHLLDPLEYESFVYLMSHCKIVLTDSGGVQEEAPSLKKPVLVMRETTERSESIEAGTAKLVGTSEDNLVREASKLIDNEATYQNMITNTNPYGDGTAAHQIINLIKKTTLCIADV